jgi:hypothetical protein
MHPFDARLLEAAQLLLARLAEQKLEVSFDLASARIALEEEGLSKCKLENA